LSASGASGTCLLRLKEKARSLSNSALLSLSLLESLCTVQRSVEKKRKAETNRNTGCLTRAGVESRSESQNTAGLSARSLAHSCGPMVIWLGSRLESTRAATTRASSHTAVFLDVRNLQKPTLLL